MSNKTTAPVRYKALHDSGMANGSFYRWTTKTRMWAQYINGDYIGSQHDEPTTYAYQPLIEYTDYKAADRMLPQVCRLFRR